MTDLFKGQDLLAFIERFKTEDNYRLYLLEVKWSDGFRGRKCKHKRFQIRNNFSRVCKKCSDTERVTTDALFYKIKFGLGKCFYFCFERVITTKSLFTTQIGVWFGLTKKIKLRRREVVLQNLLVSKGNRVLPRIVWND